MTTTMTIQAAEAIIESHVSDWDPSVLTAAARHALAGEPPHTFDGRPEDAAEMDAFCEAFKQIQSA